MKKLLSLASMAIIAALTCVACQHDEVGPTSDKVGSYAPNFVLAKTSNELKALHKNPRANYIRTREQLYELIVSGASPLAKLPKQTRESFINNLVFREGIGVVSLKYGEVKAQLTYDEFARVLAAFGLDVKQGYWGLSEDPNVIAQISAGGGVQTSSSDSYIQQPLGEDFKGAKCENHSCVYAPDSICLADCS